jgi:hypothetical protein
MRKRNWLRLLLIIAVSIFAVSVVFSRALQTVAARRYLITRLAASFGRPVDVARFDFSLLDGARLEAHSVTVAEDPSFGNEYFLRSETLTAGLRWGALLSGRFEFGSLSLLRPSLNLVRGADGHWNIERWLPPTQPGVPRPGFVGPLADSSGAQAALLYRIDVDNGRINFKQGDDKSPFALLDVSGRVDRDNAGHWQLDLEARPMRAGVELQDIGTVRLRGTIAGTSARLQPAELNLTWRAASIADALRLAWQQDYGIRGRLSLDLTARVAPPESASSPASSPGASGALWSVSAVARLTGIHAWNLAAHAGDPSANVSLDAGWQLGEAHAEIKKMLVELPGSRLQAAGNLDWGKGIHPQLHIASSTLALSDILSWYRSLRPDVAEDLRAEGTLGVDVTLAGWPLQLQQGAIAGTGGTLTAKSLSAPLHIGAVNAGVSHGGLDFAPTELSIFSNSSSVSAAPKLTEKKTPTRPDDAGAAEAPNKFVLRGSISPDSGDIFRWPPNWSCSVDGSTPRAEDWLTLPDLFARPLNHGWAAAGGFSIKMSGNRRPGSPSANWLGTMDFRSFAVSPAYINQPIRLLKTHMEYSPAGQTITISSAEGLGASWHGTMSRKAGTQDLTGSGDSPLSNWTFDLTADRLDAAELDRWLGPRARPGLLARITSFASAASGGPMPDAVVAQMAAHGRLRAGEIVLASMRFQQFDGDLELDGRTIKVRKAQANFFGGKTTGSLDARLVADPTYEFQGRFDRVNLLQLARAAPWMSDRIAGGEASATLSLSTHGIGRETLVAAMVGKGTLDARGAEIRGIDFGAAIPGGIRNSQPGPFTSVAGVFDIQNGGIDLTNFVLDQARGRLQADGRIDFSHALNIRLRSSTSRGATPPVSVPSAIYLLGGTIEAPLFTPASPVNKPAPRPSSR